MPFDSPPPELFVELDPPPSDALALLLPDPLSEAFVELPAAPLSDALALLLPDPLAEAVVELEVLSEVPSPPDFLSEPDEVDP